ncbi:hypothetical protein J6590_024539 [Homalodisca vitripennis]|nr:hypothetical protein J6590_024539 [Homalodisca vitripennis]
MPLTLFLHVLESRDHRGSRSAAIFAETVTPFLSTIFWSCVSDYLVNNNYMSRTVIRKLFGVTCNMLVAPCLLAIPLAGCSSLTVFSIYEVITFNSGLHVSAIGPNPLDLSPRHAGMISGLLRTSGIVAAIFAWEFVLTMGMVRFCWKEFCMFHGCLLLSL